MAGRRRPQRGTLGRLTIAPLAFRHPKVQRLRRLIARRSARDEAGVFVAEGATLLGDALAAGAHVDEVFVAPGGADAAAVMDARAQAIAVHELASGVIERLASTTTPQPVVAIVSQRRAVLADLVGPLPAVVCVDVRDPGNLGTLLRSGQAAGVSGVVCCDGTVDVYNPKSVRASAGAVFRLPVVRGGTALSVLADLGAAGRTRLAAAAGAGEPYDRVDLTRPVAFVLGNEAHGLAADLEPELDGAIHIPMAPHSESLNVGMSCAILCFEAARQRRGAAGG